MTDTLTKLTKEKKTVGRHHLEWLETIESNFQDKTTKSLIVR